MDDELKLKILDLMITSRCLELRMIKMSKSADGLFWIGGPGEEAFNVPLGLLIKVGHGLDYDFCHFHYRNGPTMLAMGMDPKDEIRQMHNRATDPFSGGRNFCHHYAYKPWNVVPVTSTIQTQWLVAPGTARAQKRHGGDAITVVTCGDAGTAEGDFHIGLNWASIKGQELPVLFIITNNRYGISTSYDEVHGTDTLHQMGKGYGIKVDCVDGNDAEASYRKLNEAFDYVRKERKPFLLEAFVSRLYGHSSSSGGNRVPDDKEPDPLQSWSQRLIRDGLLTEADYLEKMESETKRMSHLLEEVRREAPPTPESIYDHIFKPADGGA